MVWPWLEEPGPYHALSSRSGKLCHNLIQHTRAPLQCVDANALVVTVDARPAVVSGIEFRREAIDFGAEGSDCLCIGSAGQQGGDDRGLRVVPLHYILNDIEKRRGQVGFQRLGRLNELDVGVLAKDGL